MENRTLFWLHIKKSAGISTRSLLSPYYVQVDRVKKPKNFIQAKPEEYNDILNNYRIILGEYQFKRCLFAKTYLYPETWESLVSFAFSREPTDRCISMFYYLYWIDFGFRGNLIRSIKTSMKEKKLVKHNSSYAFDVFLGHVEEARSSDSIYTPLDNHFTTHTAPVWDDVTDAEGNVLLKRIFRLENLTEGINLIFEECGIEKRLQNKAVELNKNRTRRSFTPNTQQQRKIEEIYAKDYDLYERATL